MRKCTCCTEANLALDGRNYHLDLDADLMRDLLFVIGKPIQDEEIEDKKEEL